MRFAKCLVFLSLALTSGQLFAQSAERQWPNIKSPGLDLGDFPNSAYTIPDGAFQVEMAPFSILGEDEFNQPQYSAQFLLRYGVTDDLEFRVLSNGPTYIYTDPQFAGFSPLTLDLKVHLWDADTDRFVPASSLEIALTTDWGSAQLSNGYEPSINMNFDYPLTETLNLEWTVGYGEVVSSFVSRSRSGNKVNVEENVNQFSFQWSFEKDITDDLQLFVTGQTAEPIAGQTAGTVLGFGGFYRLSDRLMTYGILGWGVSSDAPKIVAQLGFGYAFGPSQSN